MIEMLCYLGISLYLLYIAYVDLKTCKIKNKLLVPLLTLGLIHSLFFTEDRYSSFKGFAFGGLLSLAVYIISMKNLGEGDVKLIAILGLFLGYEKTIFFLFFSCILQVFFLLFKRVGLKGHFPFAPALCMSAIFFYKWDVKSIFHIICRFL